MPAVVRSTTTHALSILLARYVAGEIADAQMAAVSDLFEDTDATPAERLAFARFYLDAMAAGEGEHAVPKPAEVEGVLHAARA